MTTSGFCQIKLKNHFLIIVPIKITQIQHYGSISEIRVTQKTLQDLYDDMPPPVQITTDPYYGSITIGSELKDISINSED